MIRRKITPTCLALLLTLAGVAEAVAQRSVDAGAERSGSGAFEEAATERVAHSILEPIETTSGGGTAAAKPPKQSKSDATESKQGLAVTEQPMNMFEKLDAIVAATVLRREVAETASVSGDLKTASFETRFDKSPSREVGQASAEMQTEEATLQSSALPNGSGIVVRPPMTRSTAPNRHYFQIENTGKLDAKNVIVELIVPQSVCIIEVAPLDTKVVGKTAFYKFPRIAAGESELVELTTTPGLKEEVVFESRFSAQQVQSLAARPAQRKVEVWSPDQESIEPTEDPAAEKKIAPYQVPARKIATRPDMNVLSGRSARKRWEENSRLSYGPIGIPGKVMVANPTAQTAEESTEVELTTNEPLVGGKPKEPAEPEVRLEPEVASEVTVPSVASTLPESGGGWFQSQLKTKIDGPQHAVTGEEAEYQVQVENASNEDVNEVLVQLSIPTGLEVTVLDRDAWFDGEARTITWKLPKVTAGKRETIRYLAKVVSPDGQLQKVTLGIANQFRGQAVFQSTVMDQYELAAPLLPFEKDAKSLK